MLKRKSTFLGIIGLLLSLSSLAQVAPGYDPAATGRDLSPAPIVGGVGAPFSMTFTFGNLGNSAIPGNDAPNKVSFGLCLSNSVPASGTAAAAASVSGPILTYFDVTYNATTNCFNGIQKNLPLPAIAVFDLYINAVSTIASLPPVNGVFINNIGASLQIVPNTTAVNQPADNDFVAVYSHTTVTAMPVSLVSFTAQAQEDRSVLLNWKTSWESLNKGYLIERSKDLKSFEQVGEVTDVAGTSNSINTYKFVDKSPYRGTSYYRLVQVDLDGSRHSYKAEPVVIDGRYGVYPNPVAGHSFTLELDEPASAVLHLYNVSGREVSVSKSDVTELSTKVSPAAKLSSGVYVLTVEERGSLRKHRLVVQ